MDRGAFIGIDPTDEPTVGVPSGSDRAQAASLESSLYQILQVLSVTLFEKTPISCALQTIDSDA